MSDALATLPDDTTTLQQLVRELLATVTELRSTIQKQQDHIQYLVRMTFGRRSERFEGPTLFDGLATAEPAPELTNAMAPTSARHENESGILSRGKRDRAMTAIAP